MKTIPAPRGIFRGTNFMTPRPIEYYKSTFNGRTVYVEISTGEGMDHEPIYGVTFRYADGGELWRGGGKDPSKMFHSLADARAHAANPTIEGDA